MLGAKGEQCTVLGGMGADPRPPPPIEGTNITLNTPEDIEKWIAERKARWPSAKRVAEKVC